MVVIAHNIRSLHNVGSIFRNAAAFGVDRLFLTGITGRPPRKEIAKVALGAQDLVSWEGGEIAEVIIQLRKDGYVIYGLEQGEGAVSLENVRGKYDQLALVLGNEVDGIDQQTVALLDGVIEIPMKKKKSLNVSVASGIAMFMLQ